MRYSVLGRGRRLRPIVMYLTGESLGARTDALTQLANFIVDRDS